MERLEWRGEAVVSSEERRNEGRWSVEENGSGRE